MDERILSLQAELAFPAPARLQAALRKEGINVPLDEIRKITSSSGTRQVHQPPPKYQGHITAAKIDDRWAADLLSFEARPATRPAKLYRHVLLVQDIFSRYLWAVALSTKSETRAAFESIIDQGRKPRELNTDKGSEFTNREFQSMLSRRTIQHKLKVGLNDIATIDRAGGVLKEMLSRRMSELGGDWLTHLEPTVMAYNKLDHSALHGNAPGEVAGDDELRFRLRVENANNRAENVQRSHDRDKKLEEKGGFRTLKEPLAFKRRAGIANWSSDVHVVDSVGGGQVQDTEGKTFDTRLVLPVNAASSSPMQVFAGGSAPRDDRRRVLSRDYLRPLKTLIANSGGMNMGQASKAMMQKQGFKKMLGELRMNFKTFVQLWPDFVFTGTGAATRISLAEPLQPERTGTLLDFQ